MPLLRRRIVILLLIPCCLFPLASTAEKPHTANRTSTTTIEDITLHDDAFHGRGNLPFIEWWYFDATLDNGYSLTVGVQVLGLFSRGIASTRLTVYDQGSLVFKNYEKYSLGEFSASSVIPSVFIAGDQIIYGSLDSMNRFVYNVTMNTPQGAVSLHFVGCTEGWKRQQRTGDWWVVILPRAEVTGTITIENTTMNVTGTGYHDHNWGISPLITLHFGWVWGTCHTTNYSITWAQINPTRLMHLPMMVVNINNNGYVDIPAETIWVSTGDFSIDHFRRIPQFFNIEAVTEHVFLVIDMEVISVDYTQLLGFVHYWRYQVHCTGIVMIDGDMEPMDCVTIMEYLRFR